MRKSVQSAAQRFSVRSSNIAERNKDQACFVVADQWPHQKGQR
jgi:hypothetical protein